MVSWFFRRFKAPKAALSVVGLDNAGKTTIIQFLQYGRGVSTEPTLGVDVEELDLFGLKLRVWDLGGQREFRKLWGEYVEKADALIYVVDGADRKRLDESVKEFNKVVQYLREGVPIAFFVNKIDLEDTLTTEETIEAFNLYKIKKNPWQVFRTSGKYGFGLINAFSWIYKKITGRTIRLKIDLDDLIIVDKGGNPVINLNTSQEIPVVYVSLITEALTQFSKGVFKTPIYSINMRGRKLVLKEGERLSALAIVGDKEDETVIGDFLTNVLDKLDKIYTELEGINREKFLEIVDKALTLEG